MKNITTYPQPSFARPLAGALPMLLCLLAMLMGSTSARADQMNVQYQAFRNEVLKDKTWTARAKKWIFKKPSFIRNFLAEKAKESKEPRRKSTIWAFILLFLFLTVVSAFLTVGFALVDSTLGVILFFLITLACLLGLILKIRALINWNNLGVEETRTKPTRKVN